MPKPKSEYGKKLLDPRWQRLRLKVLDFDNWTCVDCGDGTKTLHVHHLFYLRDHEPWEYDPMDLVTLCDGCHDRREEAMIRLRRSLRYQAAADIHALANLCEFPISASDCLDEMITEMVESERQAHPTIRNRFDG